MISFRYHLVSIVAVFAALALGVLMGTTVVNQGVIDALSAQAQSQSRTLAELRRAVDEQDADLKRWTRFATDVAPVLMADQLPGSQVVIVTLAGADPVAVDTVRQSLQTSGATVTAILVITQRMAAADDGARADLAAALNRPPDVSDVELTEAAAHALATRLADGAAAAGTDLLQELVDGRFVDLEGRSAAEIASVGGPGQSLVVLAGARSQPPVAPTTFLAPLTSDLVDAGRSVVAAETENTSYDFVFLLRADGALDGRLVTVDNADTVAGRLAVVLGLRQLLLSGDGGDYGTKSGASQLVPTPAS